MNKRIIAILLLVAVMAVVSSGCSSEPKPAPKKDEVKTEKVHIADKEGDFPDLSAYDNLQVNVSVKKQTLSILSGDKTIFRTPVSTGKEGSETPVGDFVIEPERGDFFYNAGSGEGAYYWVSFKDHGIYLFHSVPTDEEGNVIDWEADLLGKPASHGCVRMSMDSAKWFYQNIPEGTPVHIE